MSIKKRLFKLQNSHTRASGGKEYWAEGLRVLGVVERDGVLKFKTPPPPPAATAQNSNNNNNNRFGGASGGTGSSTTTTAEARPMVQQQQQQHRHHQQQQQQQQPMQGSVVAETVPAHTLMAGRGGRGGTALTTGPVGAYSMANGTTNGSTNGAK
eukprot:scaffold23975_cov132-Cylindrotheca_fusiformis.AAC.1